MDWEGLAAIAGIAAILLSGANWVMSRFANLTYGRLKEEVKTIQEEFRNIKNTSDQESKMNYSLRQDYINKQDSFLEKIGNIEKSFDLKMQNLALKIDFMVEKINEIKNEKN